MLLMTMKNLRNMMWKITAISVFSTACINTKKKPLEDRFLDHATVPTGSTHGIIQQMGREALTNKYIDFVVIQNDCINAYIPSNYEFIIEEFKKDSPTGENIKVKSLDKFEFGIKIEMYSDYQYIAKLVEFKSQKIMAKKILSKSSEKVILEPKC